MTVNQIGKIRGFLLPNHELLGQDNLLELRGNKSNKQTVLLTSGPCHMVNSFYRMGWGSYHLFPDFVGLHGVRREGKSSKA